MSVAEQLLVVRNHLVRSGTSSFRALTADCGHTNEVVARFLALLELYRQQRVVFEQLTPLGELHVRWTGGSVPTGTRTTTRTSPPRIWTRSTRDRAGPPRAAPISWDALAAELEATRAEAEDRGDADPATWDAVARELATRVAERPAEVAEPEPVPSRRRSRSGAEPAPPQDPTPADVPGGGARAGGGAARSCSRPRSSPAASRRCCS